MKKVSFILSALLVGVLASCSPSVKILGAWTSPNKPAEGYSKIFVTALTDNVLARQTVEQDLDNLLLAEGIEANSSFDILPPGFRSNGVDKDQVIAKIRENGNDAILTVALLDQTNETRYVPGTTTYAPMRYGYYGRFWGYYNYYNPVMYDPGYYTTDKNYYLEANLYDANTEELIWSSQSEATNPSSIETFSKTFSKTVVDQLIKAGLISKD
ncbi:MAG: hypothetical protein HWE15_15430 [Algoriphagus sp.]|uniref:hypothetical protein n=1 Tax=Algoriphagus sp. TaxID=1872435 RepID=UPI001822401B|nr:hypothetical protein [Algoriphagus sp.]NVJ87693.1 hypothetical protein [Algoriphagus sp.]